MAHLPVPQRIVALNVGPWLLAQHEGLRRIDDRGHATAVSQPVQDVEDVGFGGDAVLKRQFHRAQHRLLVVLQHQGQDVHDLPVAPWSLQQPCLQPAKRLGHLGKRSAVAQGPRLAPDHRQVVPPVVNGAAGDVMRTLDDAGVLAHELQLGDHDKPVGVDPQADRPVGERGRNAVAVGIEMNQAGRRHPFGVFDEAVERPSQRQQAGPLLSVHVGDATRQDPVRDLAPALDAAGLEPYVERGQPNGLVHRCYNRSMEG